MVKVLKPFKVADGDTPGIAQNIWKEMNSSIDENPLALESSRAIGRFDDKLGLELMSIVHVDGLFKGSRDEEIAGFVDGGVIVKGFGTGVPLYSFVLGSNLILIEVSGVDTCGLIDASIEFSHSDEFGSFVNEESRGPVAHVTETLDHEGFSSNSGGDSEPFRHFGVI